MGPHAVDRPDVARRIQEPAPLREYRKYLQAAGSLAGEARARIISGDAANDGAGQTENEGPLVSGEPESLQSNAARNLITFALQARCPVSPELQGAQLDLRASRNCAPAAFAA